MRVTEEQIATMREKVKAGLSRPQIARRMGVSTYTVRRHTKGVASLAVTAEQLQRREIAEHRARAYERIAARCNRALGLSFGGA